MIPLSLDLNWKTITALGVVSIGLYWFVKSSLPDVNNALNPASKDNIFAGELNAIGAAVSGDAAWTGGGALYDLGHDENGKPNLIGDVFDALIL